MQTRKINSNRTGLRTAFKFGLMIALVIIFFQVVNHFVIYNYIKLDFYLSFVALVFLLTGLLLKRRKEIVKEIPVGIVRELEVAKEIPSIIVDPVDGTLNKLTYKELQVLKLIIQGKSNKEIAEINFVEISTIKTHINNLYTKLSVKNRREAYIKYSAAVQNH